MILDSGAYSAWRLGRPIDIDQYCDYIKDNLSWIGHYVALDVINPGDPEAAAAASFANLKHMRSRGLTPVPVFHVGEDSSWLFRMLDLGCDYIGLSASSLVSRNLVNDWYAAAWSHIVDSRGRPTVKAHAFGEGRLEALRMFPWYSADSTSWIYDSQRNGVVTVDGHKLAHRNDGRHEKATQDIHELDAHDAAVFAAALARHGIDPAAFAERGAFESTVLRTYLSMLDVLDKRSKVRALQPISYSPAGFMSPAPRQAPEVELPPFKMHLVIGGNPIAAACMAFGGYDNSLVSYFYIAPGLGQTQVKWRKAASGGKGNYGQIAEFTLNPVGLCKNNQPFKRAYDILERYINAPTPA